MLGQEGLAVRLWVHGKGCLGKRTLNTMDTRVLSEWLPRGGEWGDQRPGLAFFHFSSKKRLVGCLVFNRCAEITGPCPELRCASLLCKCSRMEQGLAQRVSV